MGGQILQVVGGKLMQREGSTVRPVEAQPIAAPWQQPKPWHEDLPGWVLPAGVVAVVPAFAGGRRGGGSA